MSNEIDSFKKKIIEEYQSKLTQMQTEYEEKLRKAKDNTPIFNLKNVGNYIKYVKIEVYYILTKSKEKCAYCEYLISSGILDQLRNFNTELKLPSNNYILKEWKVDWSDRYMGEPLYSELLSDFGMNYYYASGLGVERYPCIDLWVLRKDDDDPLFHRIQGIGKYDVDENGRTVVKITIIKDIINYIGELCNNGSDVEFKADALHKQDNFMNDPIMDKMFKIN